MPAQYFKVRGYEIGGTQAGSLQYRNGTVWTDLGNFIAATQGIVLIDATHNQIPINYSLFDAGGTYYFRLIDGQGHPISNIVSFTFPIEEQPLLNTDNEGLLDTDGTPLLNT